MPNNPLLEMLKGPPEEEVADNEPREEMLDAFRTFSDVDRSAVERMDALLLLMELKQG